jgi:aromatic-amino-acid transaminase
MKEFVAKRSRQGVSKTDIIAINTQAIKDKEAGNVVINASIGTFLDDDKKVGGVELIKDSLKNHINDNLGYPGTCGDLGYCEGVMKYVFEDRLEHINSIYSPFIGATLGGTGAISQAFNLFLEEGELVLLPDVMWTNYKLIAKKAHAGYMTYSMFDKNGGLNIPSIKETIAKARETSHHVLLVINDPCQNPTGYCMTKEEYDELFMVLNEEGKKGYLTVLFDIAYISFFHVDGKECALIDKLNEGKCDFLPLICFSCSKLFGLYGLRVGALIALCPNEINRDEVKRAFGAQARGVYSVPNGPAEIAVSKVLNNPTKLEELHAQVKQNSDELAERSAILIKELDEAGIGYYPYMSGFFITLKIKNAFEVAEKMKAKHMYVVPMNEDSIRLAISGLTKGEVATLIQGFKELM